MPRRLLAVAALAASLSVFAQQPPRQPGQFGRPAPGATTPQQPVPPAATRAAVVKALKANYPTAATKVQAQLDKAKAGKVSPSAGQKRFIPGGKTPNTYKTQEAKDEHVGELETLLADLATDPVGAAPFITAPVGPNAFGRLPQFGVIKVQGTRTLVSLANASGQIGTDRPAILASEVSDKLIDGEVFTLSGLFYAAEAANVSFVPPNATKAINFRSYVLRPMTLTPEEVQQITGRK